MKPIIAMLALALALGGCRDHATTAREERMQRKEAAALAQAKEAAAADQAAKEERVRKAAELLEGAKESSARLAKAIADQEALAAARDYWEALRGAKFGDASATLADRAAWRALKLAEQKAQIRVKYSEPLVKYAADLAQAGADLEEAKRSGKDLVGARARYATLWAKRFEDVCKE